MFVVVFVVSAVAMIGTATACRNPDWGDAPDSEDNPKYPTLYENNGASHGSSDYYLGDSVDYEGNGQPNATATGDDTNGVPDDEDGFIFTSSLMADSTALWM